MKHSDSIIERAKNLYIDGHSAKSISKLINVPKGTVAGWIKKYRWVSIMADDALESEIIRIEATVKVLYEKDKLLFYSVKKSVENVKKILRYKRLISR